MSSLSNAFSLKDRVALVTGGASGIGEGCAKVLAQAGASVLIVSRRAEKLQKVKDEIEVNGGICDFFAADLTREENCKAAVEAAVEKFGGLDILINSAGYVDPNSSTSLDDKAGLDHEFDIDSYIRTRSIDLDAIFMMIKYAYKECAKNRHGSIINIASTAALRAEGPLAYTAAKGAVQSMGRVLGKRFADTGVRINTIYPGLINSEMTESLKASPEIYAYAEKHQPLGFIGDPEDIGYCALYLASDASRYVTGQDFVVDGGSSC